MNIRRHTQALLILAIITLTTTALPQTANANDDNWQFPYYQISSDSGMFGFLSPRPPFTRSMLTRALDRANVDDTQRDLAINIFEAYEENFLTQWLDNAERAADSRSSATIKQDWTEYQRTEQELAESRAKNIKKLTENFITDIELLLTDDQMEAWEASKRDRDRADNLALTADAQFTPIDLTVAVEALDIDDALRQSIQPILDDYTRDIDAALAPALRAAQRLDRLARDAQEINLEIQDAYAQVKEDGDMTRIEELQQKQIDDRADIGNAAMETRRLYDRVLDIHRAALDELMRALPESTHDKLTEATMAKSTSEMNWFNSFSRFKMAAQSLENLEQMRGMAQMQAQMISDTMEAEQAETMRSMMYVMMKAEPLSRAQKSQLRQLKAEHEQRIDELEKRAREQSRLATERAASSTRAIATPEGIVHLYRPRIVGEEQTSSEQDLLAETNRKRAEIEQEFIDRLREMLSFYQRALIAMN